MGIWNPTCAKNGHKFEARYDEKPTDIAFTKVQGISAAEIRSILIMKVYVKDVCIRCGAELKKECVK